MLTNIPFKVLKVEYYQGSVININGSWSVRQTCNISFIEIDEDNDLTNVETLLSINKKIRIFEG